MNKRQIVLVLALVGLAFAAAYGAGFVTHWLLSDRGYLVHLPPSPAARGQADERERFALFWEAWEILKRDFYGDLPQGQEVPYAAIRGVLAVLGDPYTVLVEPSPRELERDSLRGHFGGIGAWVRQREDGAITLSPMPGQPADRAGIREGDVLLSVDGTPIAGLSVDEVVALVRGPVGSTVRLTVRREDTGETLEFTVRRERIETPTVDWRMVEELPGTGYLHISLLSERTEVELLQALHDLREAGAQRLVLDLRGNPGGLLDIAVRIAGQFLDGGPVVYEQRKDGSERLYSARLGGSAVEMPLVVLVDGGTASGAEVIAGALQARGRGVLVGEKTYGKGAVQNVYDLSDGSSLHVTVAKLFTPDRRLIDGEGLQPDEPVPFPPESRERGEDPQLQRALEVLRERTASPQSRALPVKALGV
ncbi:MAG: S41 family peptidase [Anaerolineae bacterium]